MYFGLSDVGGCFCETQLAGTMIFTFIVNLRQHRQTETAAKV